MLKWFNGLVVMISVLHRVAKLQSNTEGLQFDPGLNHFFCIITRPQYVRWYWFNGLVVMISVLHYSSSVYVRTEGLQFDPGLNHFFYAISLFRSFCVRLNSEPAID